MTKQRKEILKCLTESTRPLSIDEVLSKTSVAIPHINLSTIYRNLKLLIEEEKVALVELPGEKSCYEIANHQHRHYFLCDRCEKIYFINKCPKGLSDIFPPGFWVRDHSITLNGLCKLCNK